jgi:hypothetical protein
LKSNGPNGSVDENFNIFPDSTPRKSSPCQRPA